MNIFNVAPGDRSHIPETSARAYNILLQEVTRLKQVQPVSENCALWTGWRFNQAQWILQGRLADDTERRLNMLFDALNCGTLSDLVVDQLNDLTEGDFFSTKLLRLPLTST